MRILLTGGSGDLGTMLAADLLARGDSVVNIDLAPPKISGTDFVVGSILDQGALARAMKDADIVVHIAAWHGIHEAQKTKTAEDFHELNIVGTQNVIDAAKAAGTRKFLFISSTSVANKESIYGRSKILGEEMVTSAAHGGGFDAVILRPRAFIPSWNQGVYNNFIEWANWFNRGAVHIEDVKQATLIAIEKLASDKNPEAVPVYTIDGAYEYTSEEIKAWDNAGPGTTFGKRYPEFNELARQHGLDTAKKPYILDIPSEQRLPGYRPRYSTSDLLRELQKHGTKGPPAPFGRI
jgi:nucleoside-diphosphate-sugar epimerase